MAAATYRLYAGEADKKASKEELIEGKNTALDRAKNATKRLSEFRRTAPGRVMMYGGGGTVLAAILDKKLPKLGDKVAPSAAVGVLLALYASQEDDLDTAAAAVGMLSPTLYGLGEQAADWLPF